MQLQALFVATSVTQRSITWAPGQAGY